MSKIQQILEFIDEAFETEIEIDHLKGLSFATRYTPHELTTTVLHTDLQITFATLKVREDAWPGEKATYGIEITMNSFSGSAQAIHLIAEAALYLTHLAVKIEAFIDPQDRSTYC